MKYLMHCLATFILLVCASLAQAVTAGTSPVATTATTSVSISKLPPACYGSKIAAPPVRSQTLVLVDRTTYKDPAAWRDFQTSVASLMQHSAQRVVLLPFAGIAPGQVLARALDVVIEPALPEEAREAHVIRDFKTTQACVKRRQAAIAQHLGTLLQELQREEGQPLARSEIVYTVERSLQDFLPAGLPTRVLIFSDGLQNGSGTSFYRKGLPRDINPAKEIALLRSMKTASTQTTAPLPAPAAQQANARVFWWGLLSGPQPAKPDARGVHYLNAQILAHYSEFWRTALTDWGASHVDIGPTLNNPSLQIGTY